MEWLGETVTRIAHYALVTEDARRVYPLLPDGRRQSRRFRLGAALIRGNDRCLNCDITNQAGRYPLA